MAGAPFPADWIPPTGVVSDLDLALLLVNSLDLLDEPADRLHDLSWLRASFTAVGQARLAAQLHADDLPRLRRLREALRVAFQSDDAGHVAATLNPLLAEAAGPVLVLSDTESGRLDLELGQGLTGYAALAVRLPAAVARHVSERGVRRLGACHADPCQCVFVDRSRAGTRRYCCDYCNDRAAARAYRRRRR